MAVLRTLIGEALRTARLRQHRTLREVSGAARVSLGYLSEVERGQKEASSELLASICRALGVRLSDVLRDVSETLSVLEPEPVPVEAQARVQVRHRDLYAVDLPQQRLHLSGGHRLPDGDHEVVADERDVVGFLLRVLGVAGSGRGLCERAPASLLCEHLQVRHRRPRDGKWHRAGDDEAGRRGDAGGRGPTRR